MKYRAQLLTFALFLFTVAMADEPKDTAFNNLYQRYFLLYTDTNEVAFYDVSNQLKEHYLKANNMDSYYKVWLNEVLYDTKMQKTFRAIKKCNSMLKEMEEKNDKHFCIVYSALGNIYDMRGNYRMSNKYYQQALKSCEPTDTGAIIGIYSRIASLQAHREPQKAKEVNEHFGKMTQHFPQYWKVYVVQKAEIAFYLDDRQLFDEAYKQYIAIRQEHPVLDAFGKDMMDVVYASFHGDYNRALELLSHESTDYDPLDCCDMRIHIFELMGRDDLALNEVTVRRDMRDSLNSDMLYDNMNEINAEMGLFQVKEEALKKEQESTRRHNVMLMITILLLLAALGLVISRNLMRRRLQKQLMTKNKQLEVALMRAEESDRMKDSFIEHVSHEIRTPLNIITGFTQVITNPTFKLKDDERNKMLNDININTIEITNIVNEMLDIAQDDSRQYYEKKDEVQVNQLCKDAIKDVEILNKHHLEIHLISELADDYTIHTNRKAVMKVLKQLLDNGLKFTDEGGLEIHVDEMAEEGMVRFVITDTGIGIAKEHREHIFKRFYKVDNFKQGFGLGLTLCLKTALLLGGNLSLDKDYTDGARFIFTLPTA